MPCCFSCSCEEAAMVDSRHHPRTTMSTRRRVASNPLGRPWAFRPITSHSVGARARGELPPLGLDSRVAAGGEPVDDGGARIR